MSTDSLSPMVAAEPNEPVDKVGEMEYRWIFEDAIDPESKHFGTPAVEAIRTELAQLAAEQVADAPDTVSLLDAWQQRAAGWSADEADRYRSLRERAQDPADRAVVINRAALGTAPLAMIGGAWLQWMCGPSNVDTELGMRLLSLYSTDIGVSRVEASRSHAYLNLLRRLGLAERAMPTARLAMDRHVCDEVFRFPALLLVMSRCPDEFYPELFGVDLCLRSVGLLPPVAVLRQEVTAEVDWDALDLGSARESTEDGSTMARARAMVELYLIGVGQAERDRLLTGFHWALRGLELWSAEVYADIAAALDPAHEMVELLRFKSREGAVYHQRYQLGGKPLSEWFAQADAGGYDSLLRALADSRLVRPGDPDRSVLLRTLVTERGPMFRIFTPHDLAVIRRWIRSLAPEAAAEPAIEPPRTRPLGRSGSRAATLDQRADAAGDRPPANIREAFHLLTRRADTAALRAWSLDYVRDWLARSAYEIPDEDHLPPLEWDPEALAMWIHDQHEDQAAKFDASGEYLVPPRAELIDLIVQGGLRALIDGAWLQGFTDYQHASSDVGHLLYQIYWDELGNGDLPINHPVLYRELLEDMGVHLPHVTTPEFAQWPGFREMSFEVPVYWLTISRFPRTFLPETLGLNLAEELFGVGGSLRQTQLGLRRHGFKTLFYDIHITIDNVASGHSAWAVDAIGNYMTAVAGAFGSEFQAQTWQRIRVGFRSATPPFYVNGFQPR